MLLVNIIKELILIKNHKNPIPKKGERINWCNKEITYLEKRYNLAVKGFNYCRQIGWKRGCEHYKDQYESMNELIFETGRLKNLIMLSEEVPS